MNIALRKPWTVAEFLAWEERQEIRYEFDGFRPVAMVGATLNHNRITLNIGGTLRDRLRGKPCQPFVESVKVVVAGKVRYPDVVVSCAPAAGTATVLPEPVVVFEILSPSTRQTDWFDKNVEYRDTPSIRRYVMLEQERAGALMFVRSGEDWIGALLGRDATIDMPEIDAKLSLAEAYEGVEFPPAPELPGS
ncbi:MAG TPA: Uma2 family endonuclease [Acetobacteraceae bacterium]|nr:Uma2 family endonuclease [Acetobacteraceae bacterium]